MIGTAQHEAILRGWYSPRDVAGLLMLETAVMNPFLGVFFRWGHEAIVFTVADKAVNLCVQLTACHARWLTKAWTVRCMFGMCGARTAVVLLP